MEINSNAEEKPTRDGFLRRLETEAGFEKERVYECKEWTKRMIEAMAETPVWEEYFKQVNLVASNSTSNPHQWLELSFLEGDENLQWLVWDGSNQGFLKGSTFKLKEQAINDNSVFGDKTNQLQQVLPEYEE